ncbi:MAG TPA: acetyl-CoA carboxylase biotin carboxyl carrier protein [Candidatus Deferrimicrobium sp.]|nr:acetyl-CoA carboxylase biotin carboxyl carrier protein [Candidatus Deferrimicrobium sp.]
MREKYIKKLIQLVEESRIESLEVSTWGRRVKITQRLSAPANGNSGHAAILQPLAVPAAPAQPSLQQVAEPTAPATPVPTEEIDRFVPIKSPMVGTFYAAPAPDADPYIALNQHITVGQVVCIVEAMKLMNEIESEVSGRVAKVLVNNGEPVEFGQTLFLIAPE